MSEIINMPPAAKNLFIKRFLDLPKFFIIVGSRRDLVLNFDFWSFGFVSDFVLRISDFLIFMG